MKTDPNNPPVENDIVNVDAPKDDGAKPITETESIAGATIETNATEEGDIRFPSADDLKPSVTTVSADGADSEAPFGRNKDGTPAKKRGRKPLEGNDLFQKLDSVTEAPSRPQRATTTKAGVSIGIDYRPIASLSTGLWIGIPQMFLGPDWAPEGNEETIIRDAFYAYYKSKGIAEMSPELGLGLALLGYATAKLPKPTVQSKLQGVFSWLKNKLPKRR